ncbi:MAG TPA: N-acetyl-gamma-glutamyl-phosphate reductase, partial [Candidatus Angelobacter sp.]|nr:N-acetyl-gamma-glutamyl-phosphate reductase [Candidatus Angelobacter sp.]
MPAQIQPAVVGATGYAGFELARLLYRHPGMKKPVLFTREGEGAAPVRLDEVYPHIAGNGGFPLEPFNFVKLKDKGVDLLFLATPHEVSREWVPELMRHGVRVVDLSGAWRLLQRDSRAVYQFHDADPELADQITTQAVYGIPELHRAKLKSSTLVANDGCYATS